MTTVKRLVCLANSRKLGKRCIAGKERLPDSNLGWIRPISDRKGREVSEVERRYEGGDEPSVLDVMEVSLIRAEPWKYQSENWLLDAGQRWRRIGYVSWDRLQELADRPDQLWMNGCNTVPGHNDRIPITMPATRRRAREPDD